MSSPLLAGQASIWVQPNGPNTKPEYLGCHSIGDLTEPKGDLTLTYCADKAASGKYEVKNSYSGDPGVPTTTIESVMHTTADFLEELETCLVPVYIHKVLCGRRDVFANYDRSFAMARTKVTQRTLGNTASRQPADENESTQSFDMSAETLSRYFSLEANRITLTETEDITGFAICGEEVCAGDCGPTTNPWDSLYAATKHLAASAANVANILTSQNEAVWAGTVGDPFAAGEDVQGIVCFQLSRTVTRILVARGTTDAGVEGEIAYSDDGGVTWTNVDYGAANGAYVASNHALFALDQYNIWLGTDGGRIYFSSDGGLTWTIQEDAGISASDIMGIDFVSSTTGFAIWTAGEVANTTDGGTTWSAVTSTTLAAARDIYMITAYFGWAVGDGMEYTHDGGLTWEVRNASVIGAVEFWKDGLFGIAVGSAASGNIYITINGGYDWNAIPIITNAGYNDVRIVSPKRSYVVGNASGTSGMMALISPVA